MTDPDHTALRGRAVTMALIPLPTRRPRPPAGSKMRGLSRLLLTILTLLLPATGTRAAEAPAGFVGAAVCAGCHEEAFRAWQGSHHALAMQPASPASVVGDFSNGTLEHFGTTTTFGRDGDRFMIRVDTPDGATQTYQVAYTFGIFPLQQYLIAFPGGRLQAFGIAWDNRPRDAGGQRWFHLYPDQDLKAGDRLHWTGRDQTWNHMCADCHSTGLKKNHDLTADTYATTWSEVNVACETCHGPGSRHVAWAKTPEARTSLPDSVRKGLVAWLAASKMGQWEMNPDTGIARRTGPIDRVELEACSACHARRSVISADPVAGKPFLNDYLPALLDAGLYHADGQIDGEVFEYGSFLQSRMHKAGVTCSDCHEPHGLRLRAEGNAVCAQCHAPERFEAATHHHHDPSSPGARCVSCHMGSKVYMGVDRRHDHSFRVPRPDLSVAIGVPNACNACHAERSPDWAARVVAEWYPRGRQTTPHYGLALHAGRIGAIDAERRLGELIRDRGQPATARATALGLLGPYFTAASAGAMRAGANDADPLVRMATPRALPPATPPAMVPVLMPLLSDPVRAVRIETARALAAIDPLTMSETQRKAFAAAYQELVAAEMIDGDRPESHLNLGLLHLRGRDLPAAEASYRTALRLDPSFVHALINLADLERLRGRDVQGTALLRQALSKEPDNADARHALGLALIRNRDQAGALAELREAHTRAPDNARYAYVYAIALNDAGERDGALRLLDRTHRRHPTDRDTLLALAALSRDAGKLEEAIIHAQALLALEPANADYRAFLADLRKRSPAAGPNR